MRAVQSLCALLVCAAQQNLCSPVCALGGVWPPVKKMCLPCYVLRYSSPVLCALWCSFAKKNSMVSTGDYITRKASTTRSCSMNASNLPIFDGTIGGTCLQVQAQAGSGTTIRPLLTHSSNAQGLCTVHSSRLTNTMMGPNTLKTRVRNKNAIPNRRNLATVFNAPSAKFQSFHPR